MLQSFYDCALRWRHDAAPPSESAYLERWQQSKIKPPDFYEQWAEKRHYFYTVDLQGRLFLEESPVKYIATSLKDNKV